MPEAVIAVTGVLVAVGGGVCKCACVGVPADVYVCSVCDVI